METKDVLIKNIKEWMKNDNQIRLLNHEIKEKKKQNQAISNFLIEIMKKNEIDRFDISDGKIVYSKKNSKKPISQKLLLELITKFYDDDQETAQELTSYISSNREITTKETIVHKRNKSSPILAAAKAAAAAEDS